MSERLLSAPDELSQESYIGPRMEPEFDAVKLSGEPASPQQASVPPSRLDRKGLMLGVLAYGFWGVLPLYWALLRHVDPLEVLAHRTVWGVLAFAAIGAAMGALPEVRRVMRDHATLRVLAGTGALLALNWGVFIFAVARGRVLEASLGYFINPLVSVLLGVLVLRERLRTLQKAAIALAAVGVLQLSLQAGGFPWVSVVLALSFGVYGLLRKTAKVDAVAGSLIETMFMAPIGAAYLGFVHLRGAGAFGAADLSTALLLVGTGMITALPLIWFTSAARRLPLGTVGFLQYLAPTGHFLTALLVFHEPFATRDLIAFSCIWAALALFTLELLRSQRA